MEIIIAIVGIVAFVYLTNRIGHLEKMVMGQNKVPQRTVPEPVMPKPVPEVVTSQAFVQPVQPIQPIAPIQAQQPAQPVRPQESGEELGGRWLGKIGIFAVLIGISFFLKYAFDNGLIGEMGRIILGILAGLVLLGVGQYLRSKYRLYSYVLMGGGIGVLYLTIYAASVFYDFISQPFALVFIALVTAVAVVLSIVDGAMTLAMLGVIGGFLTPILLTFGGGTGIALLTYVALLSIGVLAVSVFKRWIKLVYVAFAGTAFMYTVWLGSFYRPNTMLASAMFFLTIYFLIYLISTISHNLFRKEKSNLFDLLLTTINAFGYFGLSYMLLERNYGDILGFFAVIMAVVYFTASFAAYRSNPEDRVLNFYLPGIAIVFLTLAIPIQLTGNWITLAWLIEAVILGAIGVSTRRNAYIIFSIIVYAIGLLKVLTDRVASLFSRSDLTIPFFNEYFLMFVAALIAAYILAVIYYKNRDVQVMGSKLVALAAIFIVVANVITIYGVTAEVVRVYDQKIRTIYLAEQQAQDRAFNYGNNNYRPSTSYQEVDSLENERNTIISIIWAIYAIVLIAIGFAKRSKLVRMMGLIFFFITAIKVFIDVWSLGELHRIVSSIIFGVIALVASFAYAKYKHRIQEIMQ